MKLKHQDIFIPHISYMLKIRQFQHKRNEPAIKNAIAYFEPIDTHTSILYFELSKADASVIAHELIHVLSHICEALNTDLTEEREHMSHLMQWLMRTIMGRE